MKWKSLRTVPYIEQNEQSECGLACLAMICAYYRHHLSLLELQELAGTGRDGISLKTLMDTGQRIGLTCRAYKKAWNDLEEIPLPAILFWKGHHFVVLEKIKNNQFTIIDPAIGRKKLTAEEFQASFSFYLLTLTPSENFQTKAKPSSWKPYFQLFLQNKKLVFALLLWSVLLQILTMVSPLITNFVIDHVILPEEYQWIGTLAWVILFVTLFQAGFTFLRARFLVKLKNSLDWGLMHRFFQHLLHLPYSFFQLRSFGDLAHRANSHTLIREILSNQVVGGLLDLNLVLIFLLYFLIQSPFLALFIILIGILYCVLLIISNERLQLLSKEELTSKTKVQWMQSEILYGILTVKMAGLENKMLSLWGDFYQDQLAATKRKENFSATFETAITVIRIGAPLLILCLGTWEVMNQRLSMGAMIAYYTLSMTFFLSLSTLVTSYSQLVKVSAYLSRMNDVLETPTENIEEKQVITKRLRGKIRIKQMSFRYSKHSPLILEDINLTISPGQKVAIVGHSGAGKTTLAHLLIGLYRPTAGDIYFDGYSLSKVDLSSLRKQIGMVPQQIHLFNRTIYENITLHNPDITPEMVIEAAKLANIHEDIIKLPLGYQTVMSEFGTNFSGGQKQRIVLARALVHKPSILLLDEATSSLDNINEAKVEQYLSKMKCTRIVIAHRLSTIQNADQIIVLDQGRIIERGRHRKLMKAKGHYYQLYQASLNKESS